MLTKDRMHFYQTHAVTHIIKHPEAGLLLDMGLGKTCISLTAFDDLKNKYLDISNALVIAPKFVAQNVWTEEIKNWEHLKHLTTSIVMGTEWQRIAALKKKADIYLINRENVVWLVSYLAGTWPFDMVIIDELSSFKSAKSHRFKALRSVRPRIKRIVGLTGTPTPNGLLDLWPQMFLLDQGARLGKTITKFRETYFNPGKMRDNVVFNYNIKDSPKNKLLGPDIYEREIYEKISDICISMKASDYIDMPEYIENNIKIKFTPELQKQYDDFEKKQVLEFISGTQGESNTSILAMNAAGLSMKLQQFADGAVYDSDRKVHVVHDEKLKVLDEMMDVSGKPALVFYAFESARDRIMEYCKAYKPRLLKSTADMHDWNAGKVQMFLLHPASAGHGLNLQYGGNNMFWFGHTWSLELRMQAIARLLRQGQKLSVINSNLMAVNTIDVDMIASTQSKKAKQDALLDFVKAKIAKYS